jgi:hypothetical protein
MRSYKNDADAQKMVVLVFACLAGISTVATAVLPALS